MNGFLAFNKIIVFLRVKVPKNLLTCSFRFWFLVYSFHGLSFPVTLNEYNWSFKCACPYLTSFLNEAWTQKTFLPSYHNCESRTPADAKPIVNTICRGFVIKCHEYNCKQNQRTSCMYSEERMQCHRFMLKSDYSSIVQTQFCRAVQDTLVVGHQCFRTMEKSSKHDHLRKGIAIKLSA